MTKFPVQVSCVSYLNSTPFVYGLKHHKIAEQIKLSLDIPSVCANKLITGEAQIGLVPVASIPEIPNAERISDWCIAANGKVKSVTLLSNVPLTEIETILLDYHSVTSVNLTRILSHYFWKTDPFWLNTNEGFEEKISGTTAAVVIGDRSLKMRDQFQYVYDLSEEWKKFTGLPFVFACWISNVKLDDAFKSDFNEALSLGIKNMEAVIAELKIKSDFYPHSEDYLRNILDFSFDENKNMAINLFLEYKKSLASVKIRELL